MPKGAKCAAGGCTNKRPDSGYTASESVILYNFPKDRTRCDLWYEFIRVKRADWTPSAYSVLCAEHFRQSDFDYSTLLQYQMGFLLRPKLRDNAVPSIHASPATTFVEPASTATNVFGEPVPKKSRPTSSTGRTSAMVKLAAHRRLIELTRQATSATTTGPQSAVTDEVKYTPVIDSSPVIVSSAGPPASLCMYSGPSIHDQFTSTVTPPGPPLLAPWLSPSTFAMVKIENDASTGNTLTPILMPLMPSPVAVGSRSSEVPPYTRRSDHQYPQKPPQKHFIPRGVQVHPVTRNKACTAEFKAHTKSTSSQTIRFAALPGQSTVYQERGKKQVSGIGHKKGVSYYPAHNPAVSLDTGMQTLGDGSAPSLDMTCDSFYELTLMLRLDSDWIRPVTVTLTNATVSSSEFIGSAYHVAKIIDQQTVQLSLPLKCDKGSGGGDSGLDTGSVVVDPASSGLEPGSVIVDPESSGLDTESVVVDLGANGLEAGFIVLDPESIGFDSGSIGLDSGSIGLDPGSIGLDPGSIGLDPRSIGLDSGSIGLDPRSIGLDSGSIGLDSGSIGLVYGSIDLDSGSIGLDSGSIGLDSGSAVADLISGDLDIGSLVVYPGCSDTDTTSHGGDTGSYVHEPESGSCGPWKDVLDSRSADVDLVSGDLDTESLVIDPGCSDSDTESALVELGISDIDAASHDGDAGTNSREPESGSYGPWEHDLGSGSVVDLGSSDLNAGRSVFDTVGNGYVSISGLYAPGSNVVSLKNNVLDQGCGVRDKVSSEEISVAQRNGVSGPGNSLHDPRSCARGPRHDVATAVVSLGVRCDYALTKRVPVANAKNKDYRPYMSDYKLPITPAELVHEHSYATYCTKKKKKPKVVIAKQVGPIPETNPVPETNDDYALSEYSDSSMSEEEVVEYKDNTKEDPDWDPVCLSDVGDKPATRKNSTEAPNDDGDNDNVDREISDGNSGLDSDSGSGSEEDKEVAEKKLGCRSCEFRTSLQWILQGHVTRKHYDEALRNGKNMCMECGQVEDTVEALQQHREAEHSKIKEHKCPVCGEIFTSYCKYRTHIQGHEHKFKCDECNSAFLVKASLNMHCQRVHNRPVKNPRRHICEICGFQSSTSVNVKDHQIIVHGIDFGERFVCPECQEVFPSNKQMKNHLRRKHNRVRPTCDICDKDFTDNSSLHGHLQSVHWRSNLEVHACPHCPKKFSTIPRIRVHIDTVHLKLKKYRCTWPECVKSFGKQTHLTVHMRVHNDEKPLACPHCDFRARQRHALNYHLSRNHLAEQTVADDSAKVEAEAPDVAEDSAKDVLEAPNVADDSAKDVLEAHNLADDSAKDVAEAPNVAEESAKVEAEAPNAGDDSDKELTTPESVMNESSCSE